MFKPLTREEIRQIVQLQMKQVISMLSNNGIHLEATDKAIHLLADEGYDPQFGARPLKRVIQRQVLNELSKMVLSGIIKKDDRITIDAIEGRIIFNN